MSMYRYTVSIGPLVLERERQTERQTDRQRHRQTDRQTENTTLLHKDKDLSTSRQEREREIYL